ncbi:MAG: FAD-dependent oxidoreductase [Ignavibacteria bacterium]|nr:FAD-dependent oxidoreductase [Ignavibacteria bacterium]
MLSFWEINSFTNYDHIIIGSGILGLSVACEIKENFPERSVLIIEKGIFPEGASTKNAGFACFGSFTEILFDFEKIGVDRTIELISNRREGIELLRSRLGDDNIGLLNYGGYELIDEKHSDKVNKLEFVNKKLMSIFGEDVYFLQNEKISEFGFNPEEISSLIYSPFESQIDTGKMMRSFLNYAAALGIHIINGCSAESYSEKENFVKLFVSGNASGEKTELSCKTLTVCANAFTGKIFPELNIKPGRGQVLVTKPVKDLKFKGVFHFDEGFYYFRNFGDRVIFGGGRNLDFENEATTEFNVSEKIITDLEAKLRNVILYKQEFETEHTWSGIMGFTDDKLPLVKNISDRVKCIVSCNGMGIALSSYTARSVIKNGYG